MGIISDNILYGSSVSNGKYVPTGNIPRLIFRDQASGHSFAIDERLYHRKRSSFPRQEHHMEYF